MSYAVAATAFCGRAARGPAVQPVGLWSCAARLRRRWPEPLLVRVLQLRHAFRSAQKQRSVALLLLPVLASILQTLAEQLFA